jgi:eukaryotic-like serine/threonine-protein kinase
MPPSLQKQAEDVFMAISAAEPVKRDSMLRELCGGNQALRAEVESLLMHHDGTDGVLDRDLLVTPPVADGGDAAGVGIVPLLGDGEAQLPPIRCADGYTLISVLGSGGMGVVYQAQQERPRRTVALKLIRTAIATASVRRRFEHEAELLARLQHPGIAQIFETGVADFGHGPQQFIAMELVHGEPLTTFARRTNIEVNDRLRLMIKVCDAVHHAHQRGVIHRDLKPANILASGQGIGGSRDQGIKTSMPGSHHAVMPQPKILDFGVARVLDSDIAVTTMQTSAGELIGTLRYMSPEQVSADPNAIDARSDVYALGVILFELLTGTMPHALDNCSIADAARIIRDQPHTSLSSIHRSFRGDIETIVAKALEKDPRRRYQSAAELGLDLDRHLANQPIIARPPSRMYTARKFVRRNKAVVTGVAVAFLALIMGIIGTTRAMFEAWRQREVAEQQARIATAVNSFLNEDLLGQADPMNQPDAGVSLRAVLDRSAARVDERFSDQPQVAAAIHKTIGLAYQNLGLFSEAETHLSASLALCRKFTPSDPMTVAKSLGLLAVVHWHQGKLDECEAGYREAMAILQRQRGADDADVSGDQIGLALVLQSRGKLAEAEPLLRQALKSKQMTAGDDDLEVAGAKDTLAGLLTDMGQYAEAERLFREALTTRQAKFGETHYMTLHTANNLAVLLALLGKDDEAEALHRSDLASWSRTLSPDHPVIAACHHNLADLSKKKGNLTTAEAEYRQALAIFRKAFGDDHDDTLTSMTCLGETLLQATRTDDAEPIVREAMERRLRISGPNHPQSSIALMDYGWLLKQRGRLDDAIPYFQQGLDGRRHTLGDDHPATVRQSPARRRPSCRCRAAVPGTGRASPPAQWRRRSRHDCGDQQSRGMLEFAGQAGGRAAAVSGSAGAQAAHLEVGPSRSGCGDL